MGSVTVSTGLAALLPLMLIMMRATAKTSRSIPHMI
jgi:hypothetical protein